MSHGASPGEIRVDDGSHWDCDMGIMRWILRGEGESVGVGLEHVSGKSTQGKSWMCHDVGLKITVDCTGHVGLAEIAARAPPMTRSFVAAEPSRWCTYTVVPRRVGDAQRGPEMKP